MKNTYVKYFFLLIFNFFENCAKFGEFLNEVFRLTCAATHFNPQANKRRPTFSRFRIPGVSKIPRSMISRIPVLWTRDFFWKSSTRISGSGLV